MNPLNFHDKLTHPVITLERNTSQFLKRWQYLFEPAGSYTHTFRLPPLQLPQRNCSRTPKVRAHRNVRSIHDLEPHVLWPLPPHLRTKAKDTNY